VADAIIVDLAVVVPRMFPDEEAQVPEEASGVIADLVDHLDAVAAIGNLLVFWSLRQVCDSSSFAK